MLLLREGQTGEAWEPSKKQRSFGNLRALDIKVLPLSLERRCPWPRRLIAGLCHRGCQSSVRVWSMWDLCWTEWKWDRIFFLSEYFGFALSVSLYQCPILFCVVLLLFSEGRASEVLAPECSAVSGMGNALDRNEISYYVGRSSSKVS